MWLGAFPARTVWWLIRKAFSEHKNNRIRDKHRLQKRDNSSLSGPSDGTKSYPEIVLWIPVATIRKIPLFLRGGDTRRKKMLGDTTGILQN